MSETVTPTPTPSPTLNAPPVANGASLVQLTADEYHRLRSFEPRLAEFEREHQAAIDAKEQERLKAVGDKDGVQKLLDESNKSWQSKLDAASGLIAKVRELYHSKALDGTLSAAMAGVDFVGDNPQVKAAVAGNFRTLVASRFEVIEGSQGDLIVRDKASGRPAADVLKELLDAPEYQGFIAPKTRGGAGTDGTGSASGQAKNPTENPHPFGSLDWHAWNVQRSRQEMSGLRIIKS